MTGAPESPHALALRHFSRPATRQLGLGARLIDECIRFARDTGCKTLMPWINDVLHAARHVYEARGFVMQKQERHRSFGKSMVGQFWTCKL